MDAATDSNGECSSDIQDTFLVETANDSKSKYTWFYFFIYWISVFQAVFLIKFRYDVHFEIHVQCGTVLGEKLFLSLDLSHGMTYLVSNAVTFTDSFKLQLKIYLFLIRFDICLLVFNSILFLFGMKWLFYCAAEHFIVIGTLQVFIVLYCIVLNLQPSIAVFLISILQSALIGFTSLNFIVPFFSL